MAGNTNNQHQTEADRLKFDEKYQKELSAGTYAKKQIYDLVISFGSMALGAFAGYKFAPKGNSKVINFIGKKLFDEEKDIDVDSLSPKAKEGAAYTNKITYAFIGSLIGGIIGGIIQGYSRWHKQESERLAVQEINEDVANMKIRDRTDPELIRENDRLREMLDVETQKTQVMLQERQTPAQKVAQQGAKTPLEYSQIVSDKALQV